METDVSHGGTSASIAGVLLYNPLGTKPSTPVAFPFVSGPSASFMFTVQRVPTNNAAQIYATSTQNVTLYVSTQGWFDARGRNN